jgi:polyisoprenoid-binding protein YceI
MPAPDADRRIGPEHGRLILRTSREGLAARAGHDLTIEMTSWSGRLRVGVTPAASELTVTVDMRSMRVLAAAGGVTPLSAKDEREILRNAREILAVDRYPDATFIADTISDDAIDGMLSLLGRSHRLRLTYRVDGERYRVGGTVHQSDYGIRPFRAFLGALQVADAVRVEAHLDLPPRGTAG